MDQIESGDMQDPSGDEAKELADEQLEGIAGGGFVIELPEDDGSCMQQ